MGGNLGAGLLATGQGEWAFVLLSAGRLYLGLLLLLSAGRKLRRPSAFVEGVVDYRILPEGSARILGATLPWVELAIAVALLTGFALTVAGLAAASLLCVFVLAVVINLRRGRIITCNCYGVAGTAVIGWGTVGRNAVLLLVALATVTLAYEPVPVTPVDSIRAGASIPGSALAIALLIGWLAVVVALLEWWLDVQSRVSSLRQRVRPIADVKASA